jgi:polysaccharide export outer membrane protein
MKVSAFVTIVAVGMCAAGNAAAQTNPPAAPAATAPAAAPPAAPAPAPAGGVIPPADYVIGPGDVLTITYYRDKDMTGDYIVRPDGKTTLPLLNDIDAQGLTPEQFKARLMEVSAKLLVDPTITVGVKAINSRKVYIGGGISKPAYYDLLSPMTVTQLIIVAGGLREFVDGKNITILRNEGGKDTVIKFNYKEVLQGKNLKQNIPLKPGDTVLVPE